MSNEILYVLLPDFASHEMVYLMEAISSDEQCLKSHPKYVNKIVAPSLEPVAAIGGFKVLPDYSFETMPDDYAALGLMADSGCLLGKWAMGDANLDFIYQEDDARSKPERDHARVRF